MSVFTLNTSAVQPVPAPRRVAGYSIDARSWHKSPTEAAFLAVDLITGAVVIEGMTIAQARRITGAQGAYLARARKLTPQQRAEIEAGRASLNGGRRG
jgi:hypothetical protein